jgi:hypothetical protein
MKLRFKWRSLFFVAIATFLFTAHVAQAQNEPPKKRLRSPATVRGLIGGEAQDLYVIRARKGRTMTIQFSWRKEGDNTASFGVSSATSDGEQLAGQESDNGKRWTGKIPRTGDYIISVVAHPSAHYRLSVTVR